MLDNNQGYEQWNGWILYITKKTICQKSSACVLLKKDIFKIRPLERGTSWLENRFLGQIQALSPPCNESQPRCVTGLYLERLHQLLVDEPAHKRPPLQVGQLGEGVSLRLLVVGLDKHEVRPTPVLGRGRCWAPV